MNIQTRQLRGKSDARLVRAEELGDDVALGAGRDTRVVKLYFAGPLFTTPERTWNAEVCAALRAA